MDTVTATGPRERLLAAAKDLTYSQGMGVGVDAILREANVARRSLYQHFGGKDGLIAEVLRVTTAEDVELYRQAMNGAGDDPRARLLAVFDWLTQVIQDREFRGCRYLSADLALADPDHPAHAITRQYREDIHELLENELGKLRHPHPGFGAGQLLLLVDGLLAVGATRPSPDTAQLARQLADHVIGTHDETDVHET